MPKVRKNVKSQRLPRGYWPNTKHHRKTLRIPVELYKRLEREVSRDEALLNINQAILVAIEDYLDRS